MAVSDHTYCNVELEVEQVDGGIVTLRLENVVRVIARSTNDSVQFHVEALEDDHAG
jgi:hypothetical protein